MATEFIVMITCKVFGVGPNQEGYDLRIPVIAETRQEAIERVAQAIGRTVQRERHQEWLDRNSMDPISSFIP
jgi:hypothetical protein